MKRTEAILAVIVQCQRPGVVGDLCRSIRGRNGFKISDERMVGTPAKRKQSLQRETFLLMEVCVCVCVCVLSLIHI